MRCGDTRASATRPIRTCATTCDGSWPARRTSSTLDALPQALPHGDAGPQNLLVRPDVVVAIDVSFQHPYAFGFDLGHLLVGLAHAGSVPVDGLPEIHEALVPAFVEGVRDGGVEVSPEAVRYGYLGTLVIRSGLSSIPFELLDGDPSAEVFRQRAALTRFILDLWSR